MLPLHVLIIMKVEINCNKEYTTHLRAIKVIIRLEVRAVILSVDLNPILKKKYLFDEFGKINYVKDSSSLPGGEGIELAYLLKGLNIQVGLSGFLGGLNGAYIQKILTESSIDNDYATIKDENAEFLIFSTKDEDIIIKGKAPKVTREEMGGFLEKYNRLLESSSLICCSGDQYGNTPSEIYYDIVANANLLSKKVMIFLKGENLKYGLEASPYLVLLEKDDLENLTNLNLEYEYEIIKAGIYLMEKRVKIAVITMGDCNSIVLTPENVYRVSVKDVEKEARLNYGYMLAGFAFALDRGYEFELMLKLGQACGMINYFEYDFLDMSHIKRIMGKTNVDKFNY